LNPWLLRNEAAELVKLQHGNITKCFGVCMERSEIVLENAEKIEIKDQSYIVHSLIQKTDQMPNNGN
jgi:hypothetical protein